MTGLLPPVVRHAIEDQSVYAASESFGIVALIVLVVLLLEWEALRVTRGSSGRATVLSAVVAPLLLAVMLTVVLRVTALLP
ncbi:MAG: hypothetical protein QOG94_3853 [Solirubrobacteraceae bacterium]|nr:hypothetical protein [Solirubrobacteraceae bacterium]MEA2139092.1 hypothetical protein [Solirubrobacteraceae bacterium]